MAYMGFKAVEAKAAASGARNPAAVAAAAGRKKYGQKAMSKASALGKKKGHSAAEAFVRGLTSKS